MIDGFHLQGVTPRVQTETTNTEIIVRMVEAGFGVSIVPLLKNGLVTKGRRVGICELGDQIRPIHSGILFRRGASLPPAARTFIDFVKADLSEPQN